MTTNRRYAASIDARMNERVAETIMRSGQPQSLSNAELELNVYPLTRTPTPIPVTVWVRYPSAPVKIGGRVRAWTPKAVAVEWDAPDGAVHKAWVWSGAVERL